MDTLSNLLQDAAKTNAEYPAFVAPGRRALSYEKLAAKITLVEIQLRNSGIRPHDCVIVFLPGGADNAAALLAVACNAVAATINSASSISEIEAFVERTKARAAIIRDDCDPRIRAMLIEKGVYIFTLTPQPLEACGDFHLSGNTTLPQGIDVPHTRDPSPDDICLILSTSGTTARPKLVPFTHRRLYYIAHEFAKLFSLTEDDRCLQLMPLVHTHGIFSLLSSLYAKSSIACLAPFSTDTFFEWLELLEPTWYTAVPTIHQAILLDAPRHKSAIENSRLRFVRSSASHLSHNVLEEIESLFRTGVIETYGLTEASLTTASFPLQRKAGSVGRQASAGVELNIIDEQGHSVPACTHGEAMIRGSMVMDSYYEDAEANAMAYLEGWFHTGDQGYLDEDGFLFIIGRIKEIINRGGENIAPPEIDEIFLAHPEVIEAVTFALPHPRLGHEVAIAVVLRESATSDELELRSYASERLAAFKVPTRIFITSSIPKGPTGKYQRRHLPQALALLAGESSLAQNIPTAALLTPIEKHLTKLWEKALQQSPIALHADFFQLGGDSLQAALLMSLIDSDFEINLPVSTLFQSSTIAKLAERLQVSKPLQLDPLISVIRAQGSKAPLFFFHQDFDHGGLYCMKLAQHLDADRPLFAVAPRASDGSSTPEYIEPIAARYLKHIQAAVPHGPYILGGFCAGGTIAFEIARQLRAQDECVELVVLLNAVANNAKFVLMRKLLHRIVAPLSRSYEFENRIFLRLRSLITDPNKPVLKLAKKVLGKLRRIIPTSPHPRSRGSLDTASLSQTSDSQNEWIIYHNANRAYVPTPYDAPVVLAISESEYSKKAVDAALGWSFFAPQLIVRQFSESQNDLITIHMAAIAELIERPSLHSSVSRRAGSAR
jgi:acyl-CoA synthetase (AMP-forming)/AMP-acid ligase II/acyl carrier protein/pimeloyl-ACP methyl ester carboxylesterase